MTKNANPEQDAPRLDEETRARVELEARALRYVFQLGPDDRPEAARRLNDCALCLVALCKAAADALKDAPAIDLADILQRDRLGDECATVRAAGGWGILSGEEPLDPNAGKESYNRAQEDTAKAADLRRAKEIARLAGKLEGKDATERRDILREIEDRAGTAQRTLELPLAQLWNEHQDNLDPDPNKPHEALFLDARKRGNWAHWFNCFLSPRGGLTPGRTMLIGGGPGGGKTSLAGVLVTDTLQAGVPVTFWQLELGVEETLEHILAQNPDKQHRGRKHYESRFVERALGPWPASWGGLLTVPRRPAYRTEDALDALRALARKGEKLRRAGQLTHNCNGLFVLDYIQLLKMTDKGSYHARHDEMTDAASWLAKEAAESKTCLVILSQVTKKSRTKDGDPADGTEYSGADLQRAAHIALTVYPGHYDEDTGEIVPATGGTSDKAKPCVPVQDRGTPRLIAFNKDRGVWVEDGQSFPEKQRGVWYMHRALYGGPGDDHNAQDTFAGIAEKPKPKPGYHKPQQPKTTTGATTTAQQDEAADAGPDPF